MDILMDDLMNVKVVYTRNPLTVKSMAVDGGGIMIGGGGGMMGGGDMGGGDTGTETSGTGAKDPLLASWPFVIGISAAALAVSIVVGILLAKLKIKKGFELYED